MYEGYIFAILTGFFYGLQGVYGKILTKGLSSLFLAWGIFTFALPFVFIFFLFEDPPQIQWKVFLTSALTSVFVNIFAWNFFFKALHFSSLAHTMPFTAFTPIFIIPIEYLLLKELPNFDGFIGILLIFAGAYGIYVNSSNLLQPLKRLVNDTGTRYMLIVAFIWSLSATMEKIAVSSSSPAFLALFLHLLLSVVYIPILLRRGEKIITATRKNFKKLCLLGLITGLLVIFQFTALKGLLVSYVIAFKRAGIIVSVLLGILFFQEKNPVKNMICTVLMISGVFFILIDE